jgi:hypothetical protein
MYEIKELVPAVFVTRSVPGPSSIEPRVCKISEEGKCPNKYLLQWYLQLSLEHD